MSRVRPRRRLVDRAALALAASLLAACADPPAPDQGPGYPEARREARVTVFHDIQVDDPYRWLENAGSAETRNWLGTQERYARRYVRKALPEATFLTLLDELRGAVSTGVPQLANGRYAYRRTDAGSGAGELWLTLDTAGPGRRLVSADELPEPDGLGPFALSPDGALLAWSMRGPDGESWRWRIRDTQTGEDSEDELNVAAGSRVSWSADSRGLYYAREAAASRDGSSLTLGVWFHRAGTAVTRDVQVYAGALPPDARLSPRVTDDGRYLLLEFMAGNGANAIHYQRLGRTPARGRVIRLLDGWDARHHFIGSTERTFYLLTTADAPRGRIIAVDLDRPDPASWRTVVPEGESPLQEALLVGGRLALVYDERGQSRLFIHDLVGQLVREVELPAAGMAGALSGSYAQTELLYAWTDRRQPPLISSHDVNSGAGGPLALAQRPMMPVLRSDPLELADDGAVAVLMRPVAEPGAAGALLLTVHDGAGEALPGWQPEALAWAVAGGVWVHYEPGPEPDKAVDQLIAMVESLLARGWVEAGRVAIEASGDGATLAAVAINRRPDLFAAALLTNAPLDLLRVDGPDTGWDDPAGFAEQYVLSPYHQVMTGRCYPAIALVAGRGPDALPPWHAWKYLAAVQAAQACDRPLVWLGDEEADAWRLLAREARLALPPGGN